MFENRRRNVYNKADTEEINSAQQTPENEG